MILELHKSLMNKEISAKELTDKYLCAIDSLNPDLNAYVKITRDSALKTADIVDRKIAGGEEIGLLSGIPMSLKDNICTENIETSCCSEILRGFVPPYSATAWQRLMTEGAVMLGKANMDEFAMGCTGESSVFGATRNPHNRDFVAGGSSSGSAASVASKLAVYSLGSDTGGSVRQPSAFCGCYGLKPTYGSVSRYGLIAYASSLDQIGILASSAEDVSLVFDRISGYDPKDSTTCRSHSLCTFDSLNCDINGKRVGIPKELLDKAQGEIKAAVLNFAEKLEKMGVEVELFSMPVLIDALPSYYIIAFAEASSNLGRYDGIRYSDRADSYESIHEMIVKTRTQSFGKAVKKRIITGTFVLSEGYYDKFYAKAQKVRKALSEKFTEVFGKYDVILTPTTPKTAFKLGETAVDKEAAFFADLCTVPANLAGIPALSLPCGKTGLGLPVGVQLLADKWQENLILNIANMYEKLTKDDSIAGRGWVL
ncbi:MAG: Asp-tRNA(Asn)/Glu-tRNA(Gln) amidotransferase subunit GatA [Ruminococcaceae bacterium]|nr:Asp-tRNA(Asn)/Glu-tRNA(Gln) amidotransferase subunit GatA [Oscillospiraceae bacterium]